MAEAPVPDSQRSSALHGKIRYWVRHTDHAWLPCSLETEEDGKVTLKDDEGRLQVLPTKEFQGLAQVAEQHEMGIDDVCALQSVNEAALLHTVRVRYLRELIYTRVARVLIAVNPFRSLPIYSSQHTDEYLGSSDSTELPPHVFGLSNDALQRLRSTGRNQAVLISGESGAGKTESSKLVLSFVTDAMRSRLDMAGAGRVGGKGWVEEQVRQTSPVLESFGNAMTVRNNNSSRFGKWLDLLFSSSSELLGSSLTTYLLETTRVCGQSSGERGFHVFFQLLQARSSTMLDKLHLHEPESYNYLRGAQLTAPGVDDGACFEELCEALGSIGVDETTRTDIFKILSAVLMLGNCEFVDCSDEAQIVDEGKLNHVAELLGVDPQRLSKCLLVKQIKVALDVVFTPLRADQALAARDALARLIYGQLFSWLIRRMNAALSASKERAGEGAIAGNGSMLGVLDLAGFESFEHNSLEQLLINLSNEHLQQNFNSAVFKEELKDAEQEGISLPCSLGFVDNADCLALIDGKAGIMDLLDETMIMPKGTNAIFVAKIAKAQEKHKHFIADKMGKLAFGIHHFAGGVTYDCDGWLEKNANRSPFDAPQMLASAANPVAKEIGKATEAEEAPKLGARGATSKKPKSVSAGFRTSLKELMQKISRSEPHYIRCIKPNMEKVPGRVHGSMVMEQLLQSGVLATVRIRQQGYPVRMSHQDFVFQFRCVLRKAGKLQAGNIAPELTAPEVKAAAEEVIQKLQALLPILNDGVGQAFAVGTTKVFLSLSAAAALENERTQLMKAHAAQIQRIARGQRSRRQTAPKHLVRGQIRALLQQYGLDKVALPATQPPRATRQRSSSAWLSESVVPTLGSLEVACKALSEMAAVLDNANSVDFVNDEVISLRKLKRRTQLEVDTLLRAEGLLTSIDLIDVEKAVACSVGLGLQNMDKVQCLQERLACLEVQMPLVQAMESLVRASRGRTRTISGTISATSTRVRIASADGSTLAGASEARGQQLQALVDQAQSAGLATGSEGWLPETGGARLFAEITTLLEAYHAERKKIEDSDQTADGAVATGRDGAEDVKPDAAPQIAQAQKPDAAPQSARVQERIATDDPISNLRKSIRTLPSETLRVRSLQRAADEFDVETLETLLRNAGGGGLQRTRSGHAIEGDELESKDESTLEHAHEVFHKLQSVDFILATIETTCADVMERTAPVTTLRRLENLSRQLRRMSGYEEEVAEADRSLQKEFSRRSTVANRKTVFESQDWEELALAKKTFDTLSSCSRLKPAQTRLVHARECILESLTRPPQGHDVQEYDKAAVQNFRNILVCMGDWPAQECQRHASRLAVGELAREHIPLRDEVYMQILKQLSKNPSTRSGRLGWTLIHHLCLQAPPLPAIAEFVRTFLSRMSLAESEAAAMSRACLEVLDRSNEDRRSSEVSLPAETVHDGPQLKAEVARLTATNRHQASQIQWLTAELLRLGGSLQPGMFTTDAAGAAAAIDPELAELKRQALQKGMLLRQANGKSADELRQWLALQAQREEELLRLPAMATAPPRGGPGMVRFMDFADSDSDIEIDLSEFADPGVA